MDQFRGVGGFSLPGFLTGIYGALLEANPICLNILQKQIYALDDARFLLLRKFKTHLDSSSDILQSPLKSSSSWDGASSTALNFSHKL